MAKKDFITNIDNHNHLVEANGKWYCQSHFEHLQEATISGENLLLEYYLQVSNPSESKMLDGWQVWIYGNDRPQNPPHCHFMKDEYNLEIHLQDMQLYHMKSPQKQNLTWGDTTSNLKDIFETWLMSPCVDTRYENNAMWLFKIWDVENPNNKLADFVEKNNLLDKIHPLLREYLVGKPIDVSDLISKFYSIVLPIYNKDEKERERLHKIIDPIQFAQEVGLPFEFTEYNSTQKIKNIIKQQELTCYQMVKLNNK